MKEEDEDSYKMLLLILTATSLHLLPAPPFLRLELLRTNVPPPAAKPPPRKTCTTQHL